MTYVINQGMAMYWGTSRWTAMEIMVSRKGASGVISVLETLFMLTRTVFWNKGHWNKNEWKYASGSFSPSVNFDTFLDISSYSYDLKDFHFVVFRGPCRMSGNCRCVFGLHFPSFIICSYWSFLCNLALVTIYSEKQKAASHTGELKSESVALKA